MSGYQDAPSIIQDKKECFLSGAKRDLERHHIFGGANRKNSAKYGLWVYLTHYLHNEPPFGVHFDKSLMKQLHQVGQRAFEQHYPDLDFFEIFGENYL